MHPKKEGALVNDYDKEMKFDSLVEYRFSCEPASSISGLKIGVDKGGKAQLVKLGVDNWSKLGVFSWKDSNYLKDRKPQLTYTTKFKTNKDCKLNFRARKVVSKQMIKETKEKISWVSDLYSFYKPLINSKTPLSESKKKELKNTLFKMEKTLEDIINEIKTSFLTIEKESLKLTIGSYI